MNQGTSGAQAPYLTLHDIIVGARALDYGNFTTGVGLGGAGSNPLAWTPVAQSLRDAKQGGLVAFPHGFAGDPEALRVALRTRNSMGRVFSGVIGSAHEINLELDRVRWTHRTFGMDVEDGVGPRRRPCACLRDSLHRLPRGERCALRRCAVLSPRRAGDRVVHLELSGEPSSALRPRPPPASPQPTAAETFSPWDNVT